MKKFVFLFIGMAALLCSVIRAQEYVMTAPIGYGAGTTGGGEVAPVIVNAYSDLNNALSSTDAKVILIEGKITFPEDAAPIGIRSNKTLIGLPGAILEVYPVPQDERKVNGDGSGLLSIGRDESNIIIRNLIFQGPGSWDTNTGSDLLSNRGVRIWVDHCEFYDGMDGSFDNTNRADNITISWCKFGFTIPPKPFVPPGGSTNNHRYPNLVGGSDNDSPADGQYSITFVCNYWGDGCNQRMPRARNAQIHILNCYYNTPGNGVAIGLGAGNVSGTTCYVENCDFKDVNMVSSTNYPGTKTIALTFAGCIGKPGTDVSVASKPTYGYTPMAAGDVEAAVTGGSGAGATLNVERNGSIRSK